MNYKNIKNNLQKIKKMNMKSFLAARNLLITKRLTINFRSMQNRYLIYLCELFITIN